ncbi:MAG TPA: ABC transporter substrate-binding protein, partial [Acetobacteraceae bacterium]|nr:ABC transporter substrate-binding protein [Acetobacteraceae bacterium]
MRMRAWVGGALVAAALGLPPAHAQKAQDTLRVAWRDAVPNVDFYYNNQRTGLIVSHHVWDTLVYRDPETFQLKPQLAASWRYVDETSIEFELRPNVTFHDGSKFTADDVVYTINLVLNDKQISVPTNYSFIDGAEKIDDLHVRIRLKRVFPAALEYFSMVLPIYPKAYRERVGADFSKNPVGTGPYKVTKVDGVTQIDLERNDTYFDGPKGKPAIKRIVIKEVADSTGELTQLLGGQVDWIWGFSADQLDKIGAMPNLQVL